MHRCGKTIIYLRLPPKEGHVSLLLHPHRHHPRLLPQAQPLPSVLPARQPPSRQERRCQRVAAAHPLLDAPRLLCLAGEARPAMAAGVATAVTAAQSAAPHGDARILVIFMFREIVINPLFVASLFGQQGP